MAGHIWIKEPGNFPLCPSTLCKMSTSELKGSGLLLYSWWTKAFSNWTYLNIQHLNCGSIFSFFQESEGVRSILISIVIKLSGNPKDSNSHYRANPEAETGAMLRKSCLTVQPKTTEGWHWSLANRSLNQVTSLDSSVFIWVSGVLDIHDWVPTWNIL